uniref:CSON003033 protein n=1 Tax=Culicoides sonorensis TaxID=179676 RepID=A0A336L1W8_CULSO
MQMMESLQLPFWMEETMPTSNPSSAYHQINNEELQLFDNFATENDFLISNDNTSNLIVTDINTVSNNDNNTSTNNHKQRIIHNRSKPKTAHELLLELDEEIQSEPSWYHNPKLDFVYEQLSPVPISAHHGEEEIKIQKNTEELLSEFDTVCNAVGLQLTPPTTPPMSPCQKINPEDLLGAPIVYIVSSPQSTINDDCVIQELPQTMMIDEILSEESDNSMDLIDELVREHTTNLPDDLSSLIDDSCSVAGSQISDNVSISSHSSDSSYSPSRNGDDSSSFASFMSPRSDDSYDIAGYDDEWTPTVDKKKSLKKSTSNRNQQDKKSAEPKKAKRPYGRPLHEKKARKKEQNKEAATRYRQKKKELLKIVLSEEDELLQVNRKLQTKYDDVKREIKYLKQLMKEILIAKGLYWCRRPFYRLINKTDDKPYQLMSRQL